MGKIWGISCEKSRFYAKKSYFFPLAEGGAKIVGVFRVKNHDFTPKNHIFSNFRGRAPGAPPGSAPGICAWLPDCSRTASVTGELQSQVPVT